MKRRFAIFEVCNMCQIQNRFSHTYRENKFSISYCSHSSFDHHRVKERKEEKKKKNLYSY